MKFTWFVYRLARLCVKAYYFETRNRRIKLAPVSVKCDPLLKDLRGIGKKLESIKKISDDIESLRVIEAVRNAKRDKSVLEIELTPHEVQSGLDRLRFAENLIKQLPDNHEGRNSWLLNYSSTSKR